MTNFNNATIYGFITGNGVTKVTKAGKTVLTFELAINHYSAAGEVPRISFLSVEAREDVAIKHQESIVKGKQVMISGVLRQDRWEDERGRIVSRLKIIANEITFI